MIFLWFYAELYAVQPWVRGFQPPVIFNGQPWTSVTKSVPRPTVTKTAPVAEKAAQRGERP